MILRYFSAVLRWHQPQLPERPDLAVRQVLAGRDPCLGLLLRIERLYRTFTLGPVV